MTKAHLRTGDSGVVRQMSTATNRNDGTVRIHHRSIAPSSTQTDYVTSVGRRRVLPATSQSDTLDTTLALENSGQHVVKRFFIRGADPHRARWSAMIRAPAQLYRGDRFCPPAISPPCAD